MISLENDLHEIFGGVAEQAPKYSLPEARALILLGNAAKDEIVCSYAYSRVKYDTGVGSGVRFFATLTIAVAGGLSLDEEKASMKLLNMAFDHDYLFFQNFEVESRKNKGVHLLVFTSTVSGRGYKYCDVAPDF